MCKCQSVMDRCTVSTCYMLTCGLQILYSLLLPWQGFPWNGLKIKPEPKTKLPSVVMDATQTDKMCHRKKIRICQLEALSSVLLS